MENNKKFELNDDALEQVAGGRWYPGGEENRTSKVGTDCVRNENYACCNCGGHDFRLSGGTRTHYHGDCVNCGTHHQYVCRVDFAGVEYYIG